jgi:rsbT co-antagonist protein RsbR
MKENLTVIATLIDKQQKKLLDDWMACQRRDGLFRGRQKEADVTDQAKRFLNALREAVEKGRLEDISTPEWASTRDVLDEMAQARVAEGSTPTETATFVFSLKEPLFSLLRAELGKNVEKFAQEVWGATVLLDKLGLYTFEGYQKNRESVILRQQQELLELSTPVVQLWDGVLALPLIGTLDSARTQVVMENLLEQIVSSGAEIAIIDITGVPTVDTLVAQHLIKTVSAARLMGADCIISGIRPQIAQTIVHLGLELDVVSKATMADAFALALRRIGKTVVDRAKPVKLED